MRRRWLATVAVLVAGLTTGSVAADSPVEPAAMPAGTTVSRPLQPVQVAEPVPPPPTAAFPTQPLSLDPDSVPTARPPEFPECGRPLPHSWQRFELLFWWAKPTPVPPLATAGRSAAPPVLGGPGTQLLVGGGSFDSHESAGGRFTVGFANSGERITGWELTYLFLGTRTYEAGVADPTGTRFRGVGRPFVNARTGAEDVLPVAGGGAVGGAVTASASSRVQGWEANGVLNLFADDRVTVNALAGYRYFLAHEGLRVEQVSERFGSPLGPPIRAAVADQFDAHNRFHGGQLGLQTELGRGPVFVELTGKVAFGQTFEVVKTSGQTVMVAATAPLPFTRSHPAGVLGLPTNSGRDTNSAFAVLPEGQFRLGYQLKNHSRLYLGYSFLYLSDAVSPGDQVDRTLDPSQIPLAGGTPDPLALLAPPERPAVPFHRTDFWVQGVTIGLEYRY